MASDNTLKDNKGNSLEVYENDMYMYADMYLDTLPDKDIIYRPNSNTFTGLIKYIYNHIKFTKDIYLDINTLDNIWNTYVTLCYKYNQNPTIEEYCILIGISRDTIYSWLNGTSRGTIYRDKDNNVINDFFSWSNAHRGEPYSQEPCSLRTDTIKKWQEECKMGRYKSAASGNIGGIFLQQLT